MYILREFLLREFHFLFSSKYHFDLVLIITREIVLSNKRNRSVLDEEDEYIINEYEYPSDNGSDEDPTQVDNS